MAEYINIRGQSIEVVASDPANPTIGQIWYNSTSNTLKGESYAAAAWATGGTLPTGTQSAAACGTQTASIVFGGYPPKTTTLEYNGSSWTSATGIPYASYGNSGFGVQTAAVGTGGFADPSTQFTTTSEYNGTSWTSG